MYIAYLINRQTYNSFPNTCTLRVFDTTMFFKAKLGCSFYRSMLVILTCLSISSQPWEYKGVKNSNATTNMTNGMTNATTNMTNGTEKESHSVSILPYEFYNYSEFGNWEWQKQKTELKGIIQLSEKYKENSTFGAKALLIISKAFLIIDTINLHCHWPFKKTKLLTFLYRLNHDNIRMRHFSILEQFFWEYLTDAINT
jgi:hypothetical protein